jgi:hypothetical protein
VPRAKKEKFNFTPKKMFNEQSFNLYFSTFTLYLLASLVWVYVCVCVLSRIVYARNEEEKEKGKIGIGRRQSEVHTLTVSRNKLKAARALLDH